MTERGLKKTSTFFIQRLQTFLFIFVTFLLRFNVVYFFLERFFYICVRWCPMRAPGLK